MNSKSRRLGCPTDSRQHLQLTGYQIAHWVEGTLHQGGDVVITNVQTDSRNVYENSLYIARIGESTDGHRFIPQALAAGASALIVTDVDEARVCLAGIEKEIALIEVADATLALGMIAAAYLESLRVSGDLRVIGITGSAGKTTTKDMLKTVLSKLGATVGPEGSFNNEVGMPLTILEANKDTRYLVLEMGASAPGNLRYLTGIAPLDIGVELMVGRAHLAGFGSVEDVAKAKAELIEGARVAAVLNADDPYVMRMPTSAQRVLFSSCGTNATDVGQAIDVYATDIYGDTQDCYSFTLHTPTGEAEVSLGLSGRHNISNALAVASVAHLLGMEVAQIAAAISGQKPHSAHRLHTFTLKGATIIDDAYNANPDSMVAALHTAAAIHRVRDGRLVVVLGSMLELGATSAELHREVGDLVNKIGAQVCITVGIEAEVIHKVVSGRAETFHVQDAAAAFNLVRNVILPGDTVLIKGSNGSRLWWVAQELSEVAHSQQQHGVR